MTHTNPDRLLTTRELADRLRVKPKTIWQWARDGRIPVYRIGQQTLRFRLVEVLAKLRGES